ncbi:uncharacterized protein LOC112589054 [Harpegnathos saltator]|uniref:uncharacterized protein LOC112589054 n=1 Tax=Harpegnathos saltator TaxID=610380 RepID=UPI000DBEDC31|nr:uncharacterized protein LOC112589054 [Harpegnathos saltator]
MYIVETKTCAGFEWATKLNRLTLNIAGIWPNDNKSSCDKLLSDLRALFSLLLFIFIGAIPAIHALLRTRDDMMAMIDNLQFTLPLLTTIIKVIVIWWKKTVFAITIDIWKRLPDMSDALRAIEFETLC